MMYFGDPYQIKAGAGNNRESHNIYHDRYLNFLYNSTNTYMGDFNRIRLMLVKYRPVNIVIGGNDSRFGAEENLCCGYNAFFFFFFFFFILFYIQQDLKELVKVLRVPRGGDQNGFRQVDDIPITLVLSSTGKSFGGSLRKNSEFPNFVDECSRYTIL
jgi:hypothetical protein